LPHDSDIVEIAGFSPDGRRLLTLDDQGLKAWDPASGRLLSRTAVPGPVSSRGAVLSPDGKHLVLAYPLESKLEVRDARSGRLLASWPSSASFNMAFSRDGKRLIVTAGRLDVGYGFGQPNAELWDFGAGWRILTLTGHSEAFHTVVSAMSESAPFLIALTVER